MAAKFESPVTWNSAFFQGGNQIPDVPRTWKDPGMKIALKLAASPQSIVPFNNG